ncbi:MAG: pyrophosphohydrolase including oxidative damage repair enzyme [Candidatus Saccharibacteria bacterium]|nr:pyrophosphohydrolase including oxidative damage repair enzyme [Candidatus Saccharibacteria bacterium]
MCYYLDMAHIHAKPGQHDFTASAFIVRLDTPKPSLMLHMHKKLHKYLQFGGHVELHETPWQAVTHEIAEESGYDITQLKLLQPQVRLKKLTDAVLHPQPIYLQTHQFADTDHYHTDVAFAFVTSEEPSGSIHAGESADIRLFTLDELKAMPVGQIAENVRDTGIFVLEECLEHWQVVQ